MIYENGERMRDFLGLFISYRSLVFLYFGGVFNETIIPLALVGYGMIITNATRLVGSYPTRAHEIIVNYNMSLYDSYTTYLLELLV